MLSITDIIMLAAGAAGAAVTLIAAVIIFWVDKRYSIKHLQTEKILNWLHELNTKHYSNLATYSGELSRALQDKRLPKDVALIEWCLYLIGKYVYYGEKFESAAGMYLVYSAEGMRDVSKLSQLTHEWLLYCFKESLQDLANLGELEFFEFKERLREDHRDIEEKFREWIKHENNRRELVVFSYLYSALLNAEVLSTYRFHYWRVKKIFRLKRLYKSAKKVIALYEHKEVIERNLVELTGVVNEYSKEYGYDDDCTIVVFEELLVFKKRFFRFVKFGKFPQVISVKKAEKGVGPFKKFEYKTKYKHIEEALEKSQRLKEEIEKDIRDFL